MIFFAKLENKKLVFENTDKLCKYLETLKDDIKLKVKIEPHRPTRSVNQNALYWKWLNVIADELGYSSEELHDSFKAMYLTDRSQKIPLVRSTTMLDKMQFTVYLNKVEQQANELGILLPIPEEI